MRSAARAKGLRNDGGTVTAEFAITLPAVLVILAVVLGGVYLAAERVALVTLAGEVARLEARGDTELAAARIAGERSTPAITRQNDGRVLCVTAASSSRSGPLGGITVTGRGCAAIID